MARITVSQNASQRSTSCASYLPKSSALSHCSASLWPSRLSSATMSLPNSTSLGVSFITSSAARITNLPTPFSTPPKIGMSANRSTTSNTHCHLLSRFSGLSARPVPTASRSRTAVASPTRGIMPITASTMIWLTVCFSFHAPCTVPHSQPLTSVAICLKWLGSSAPGVALMPGPRRTCRSMHPCLTGQASACDPASVAGPWVRKPLASARR